MTSRRTLPSCGLDRQLKGLTHLTHPGRSVSERRCYRRGQRGVIKVRAGIKQLLRCGACLRQCRDLRLCVFAL